MSSQLFPPTEIRHVSSIPKRSALEDDFPAAALSEIGLKESWRKEVHRPATSTHKWWAKRLGSVFRGILTSAVSESAEDALALAESSCRLDGLVVMDPFGGSGTTAVEALKLGASIVSFDINPVATLVERQAVQPWNPDSLEAAYRAVESACRHEIDRVHRSEDGLTVLYYFWVAKTKCPDCHEDVRLFDSPVFSKNAYPKRKPDAKIVCPVCLDIQDARFDFGAAVCSNGHEISPYGAVERSNMTCVNGHTHKVTSTLGTSPPRFEMYATMVVDASGKKSYRPASDWDRNLFAECEQLLETLPPDSVLPCGTLREGNNTDQAINWNFTEWRRFFNARQLYSLSLLATAIRDLDAPPAEREALCALFSGTLEFNNMFASFKGEGTGAVRHMFSHHILKPERTPLEAHPWGTPASSGSFSGLMRSRILRAHEYKTNPVDLVIRDGEVSRVSGISLPIESHICSSWKEFAAKEARSAYISTTNSAQTDIPSEAIDLVITDPPYMDNVHYAELADFFHAWLQNMSPYSGYSVTPSTRSAGEVQDSDPSEFGKSIGLVWGECARVLRPEGLLAFTFHQARIDGWIQVLESLVDAGFTVTSIQPVKGEMTRSIVKSGAREPSNLDSIVVCRKTSHVGGSALGDAADACEAATERLRALQSQEVEVGPGDVRSVVRGTMLASAVARGQDARARAGEVDEAADRVIEELLPGPQAL
jgi:putative DNA methylase